MTSLYFDTTYLGKLHWPEPGSGEVAACAAVADELVCALHGRAEFHSISHRKLREDLADAHATRVVTAQNDAECASGAIRLLPLTDAIVDRGAQAFATAPATAYLLAAEVKLPQHSIPKCNLGTREKSDKSQAAGFPRGSLASYGTGIPRACGVARSVHRRSG